MSDNNKSATNEILRVEGLSKTYHMGHKAIPVLRDVSLQIRAGESVAIVGCSGTGKSTLLHIIGGLDQPTGGRVIFQGQDLYRMPSGRRTQVRANRIGFVFQIYHLLPELDVFENVFLPSMSRNSKLGKGQPLPDGRERALSLLQSVGLSDRVAHLPAELSGGEQQRVALARALMNQPDLVLADEPTGNLDALTGEHVLDILFSLTREKGHTLILVTHNHLVARRCSRVLELKDGCLALA